MVLCSAIITIEVPLNILYVRIDERFRQEGEGSANAYYGNI
jgi:hypothetical protein